MPELPEVETIRQTLKQLVINKTISYVEVYWPNIIKHPDVETFKQLLENQAITDIKRRGKFLLFILNYYIQQQDDSLNKHTHVIFTFTNGEQLRYNDVRKFGTMHVFKKGEETTNKPLNQLGPEPFDEQFTFNYFAQRLKRTRRNIKSI